jgi:phosphohistidine phosphatase SixA
VAEQLHAMGWIPDVVRGSDAVRTRQTWDAMAGRLPRPVSVTWTNSLLTSPDSPQRGYSTCRT